MNKPHRTSGESLLSLQYRPNRKCVELVVDNSLKA